MAKINSPRKVFNFRIGLPGFDEYEAQKLELPDIEIAQTAHGDTNYDVKTAGRVTTGNMKLEKLRPLPSPDNAFYKWLAKCQNMILGGGVLPPAYKQIVLVSEMDTLGLIPITVWVCEGTWPCKMPGLVFDRMSSDNQIQKIEFSVDRCYPTP